MNSKIRNAFVALRRFLPRFSFITAFLVLGIVGPVGLPTARATDDHQTEVANTKRQIAEVKMRLAAARTELRNLQEAKPKAPAKGASLSDTKAYNVALANWQQKVDGLTARIASLQTQLRDLEKWLRTQSGQKNEDRVAPTK